MPLLIAPTAFKGTLSAHEVAEAIAEGAVHSGAEVDLCPIADGGDGTADVLLETLGGERVPARATDPLGRPVQTEFALLADGKRAVVEVAAVSGLTLLDKGELDPWQATSYGTGELILAAAEKGAKEILVAAGGSATVDGGEGALTAIADHGGLAGSKITVLCDVRTPLEYAAELFGPQKGADEQTVRDLHSRLLESAATWHRNPVGENFTGAAGGLAGGMWSELDAKLVSGAGYVLDALDFDRRIRASRAVVVGEGRFDSQTLWGKAAGEAATRARQAGVPCHAVSGSFALNDFEARILDLQLIIEATQRGSLVEAGSSIASL